LMLLGCDHAQGYGIARPMPVAEFKTWFDSYQANQEWLELAHLSLSPRQKLLTLLVIESKRWLERLITTLESPSDEIHQWPAINLDKSLSALWLGQARKQQLFDPAWIDQLEQDFKQLHQIGSAAKELFLQGKYEEAQTAIPNLQKTYATIDELLEHSD